MSTSCSRPAVALGAPLLRANFPRAYARREPRALRARPEDVRRQPADLRQCPLGARRRRPRHDRPDRRRKARRSTPRPLHVEEGLARIDAVYKPYHRALRELIVETHSRFGFAVLLDCHSMPSTVRGGSGRLRPDIVLGDRYGTSCAGELTDARRAMPHPPRLFRQPQQALCRRLHHRALRPAGARLHAMQIEVNRCLYMDERTLEKSGRLPAPRRRPVAARGGLAATSRPAC